VDIHAVSRPHLGVVIPAYNEEPRIEKTLNRIAVFFDSVPYSCAALIVSDGSTDKTKEIVQKFSEQDHRFSLHAYTPNRGKGYAVRTGMLMLEADWLLMCDADLATPIEEVQKLFDAGKPVVVGSRALDRTRIEIRQPWYRELAGKTLNRVVQWLAIPGIWDTQCGFKLFSYEAARAIFSRCRLNGFSFDFEALLFAKELGFEIAEVPVRWSHQEGSKVRLFIDGIKMVRDLIWLRLTFRSRL